MTGRVELVGVEWTLLRFVSDGVESVPGDYPLEVTLGITRTGALSATDGCNWLSGGAADANPITAAGSQPRPARQGPTTGEAPEPKPDQNDSD